MALTDQVCRIQFIPKNEDTFRSKGSKNTIAQYLNMNEFTIGSSKEANIIYKMRGIHPVHLRVIVRGRDLYVEDVFSTTGVTINGKIIKPGEQVPYKAGEFIQLGSSPDIITVEMFRKPVDPRMESQEIVLEAEKKANEILRQAQGKLEEAEQADEKSQLLIDAAKDKADEVLSKRKKELELLYEDKVKAAVREGQDRADETSKTILEKAQEEVHSLLMKAQDEADDIKREAENRRVEVLEEQENLKKESAELERRKEELQKHIENVLSENEELLNKNAEFVAKSQQVKTQYEEAESKFKNFQEGLESKRQDVESKISDLEAEYNSFKEEFDLAQQNCHEARKETEFQIEKKEEVLKEIEEKRQEALAVQREIDGLNDQREKASQEAEQAHMTARSQMEDVRLKIEEEYEKRKNLEIQRLQGLRERERVRIYQTIDDVTASIATELDFEIPAVDADKHYSLIEKAVTKIVVEEFELREKVQLEPQEESPVVEVEEKKTPVTKTPHFSFSKRAAMPLMTFAALVVFFAIKGQWSDGGFSAQREIQSIESEKEGLWKGSYTENILYVDKYLRFTKKQKVNKRLKKALDHFLRSKLKLSKDAIVQFTVQEGMLIWELKKIKSAKLSPEEKKSAMQSKERELLTPLVEILGGEEQFDKYFNFQREQFINAKK